MALEAYRTWEREGVAETTLKRILKETEREVQDIIKGWEFLD
jgi:hypothetical protein